MQTIVESYNGVQVTCMTAGRRIADNYDRPSSHLYLQPGQLSQASDTLYTVVIQSHEVGQTQTVQPREVPKALHSAVGQLVTKDESEVSQPGEILTNHKETLVPNHPA